MAQAKLEIDDQCSICLEEVSRCNYVFPPCMHRFHRTCLERVLEPRRCPNCRAPYSQTYDPARVITLREVRESPELCSVALEHNGFALQYATVQTHALCMRAVAQNGLALKHVLNQTAEICLTAVRANGLALQYVCAQTPKICLAAVKECGFALKYVRAQTRDICLAAVRQTGFALECVRVQTFEICAVAIDRCPLALNRIIDDALRDTIRALHHSTITSVREKI